MDKEALGVIETVGMAAAIQAADTCVKSANVELIGYELSKGYGLVTIKIRGNVGAVKAAIEAAKVSSSRVNQVYATLIIPRPAANLYGLIESGSTVGISANENESKSSVEEESKDKLEDNVAQETNEDVQKVEQNLEDSKILEINNKNDSNFEEEDKTLVSNDFVLDDPRSPEDFQEKKVSNKKDEAEEFIHDDCSLNEQESDEVCNICRDPACTRKKGQPKTLCINYKGTRR